jgi:hypothetical protein
MGPDREGLELPLRVLRLGHGRQRQRREPDPGPHRPEGGWGFGRPLQHGSFLPFLQRREGGAALGAGSRGRAVARGRRDRGSRRDRRLATTPQELEGLP